MGLFKKFVSQTRKPDGFLGKMMLSSMNSGHAKLADWGFSHLPNISSENAVDLGCGGGRNAGELLKNIQTRASRRSTILHCLWRRRKTTTRP